MRFTEGEVRQLLDSADDFDFVLRLPDSEDAYDRPVRGKYTPTESGRKLAPPRGASLLDLGSAGVNVAVLVRDAFKAWWPIALPLAGLLGVGAAFITSLREWLIAALVLTLVSMVLAFGTRGELELKSAAECLVRMMSYRPHRYRWQTHAWRHWFLALVIWTVALLAALAIVLWWPLVIASVLVGVVAWAVYRREIRPLKDDWVNEAKQGPPLSHG